MILGLALGSYSLAVTLHVSAPIAAVVAGLYIGNRARDIAMSTKTQAEVDSFFAMVDSLFNNLLFGLIGASIILSRCAVKPRLNGLGAERPRAKGSHLGGDVRR